MTELEAEREAHAATRKVLEDLLTERGLSDAMLLLKHRETLIAGITQHLFDGDGDCLNCNDYSWPHDRKCKTVLALLDLVPGTAENEHKWAWGSAWRIENRGTAIR